VARFEQHLNDPQREFPRHCALFGDWGCGKSAVLYRFARAIESGSRAVAVLPTPERFELSAFYAHLTAFHLTPDRGANTTTYLGLIRGAADTPERAERVADELARQIRSCRERLGLLPTDDFFLLLDEVQTLSQDDEGARALMLCLAALSKRLDEHELRLVLVLTVRAWAAWQRHVGARYFERLGIGPEERFNLFPLTGEQTEQLLAERLRSSVSWPAWPTCPRAAMTTPSPPKWNGCWPNRNPSGPPSGRWASVSRTASSIVLTPIRGPSCGRWRRPRPGCPTAN
jgi:hypothetical protein